MMSEQHHKRTPKKFLKKGEGLKRFAAYKPPLPVVAGKRRQTFVKFQLDQNKERLDYLPPDILYDDSINLSTEIPKIAPPKIMHTPIKPPNRQASRRYNLRCRRQLSAVVERHVSPTPSPSLTPSPSPPPPPPQSQHSPPPLQPQSQMLEDIILALGKQIQQVQSTVHELKENINNCKCGVKVRTTRRVKAKSNEKQRPSADADKSTTRIMSSLMDEIAQLKERFNEINLQR